MAWSDGLPAGLTAGPVLPPAPGYAARTVHQGEGPALGQYRGWRATTKFVILVPIGGFPTRPTSGYPGVSGGRLKVPLQESTALG
jgi:hypothetical protein